ncbi:MAG: serine O-acetyltransferase, partial [Gammaproteobacteria bacterium]|nr:serine O-acetyltransferase [Gammaproteobacteria bacterium]
MSDEIWNKLRKEAEEVIKQEPLLASYVYACILNHDSLQSALSFILATKLSDDVMPVVTVRELFDDAFNQSPEIIDNARCDILAVYERDAAIDSFIPVLLNLKGFQSIQVHRLAHFLWTNGRKDL